MQLFDAEGRRLYVTEEEHRAFVAAASKAPREVRTFCGVLHATGCRISEALALTAQQIDLSGRVVVFESLKKRRRGVYRAVPVPPELLDALDLVHGIRQAQRRDQAKVRLWPWSRMTAYRRVQEVIAAAARFRRAGCQPGHCPQHGAEVAGSRPAHHDRDLRERRGRRGAEPRSPDVVTRPRKRGTVVRG
jgi:integrase